MKATSNTITHVDNVRSGTIAMWSGPRNTIPAGWYVCDGSRIVINGKPYVLPNLKDRFIQGAIDDTQLGDTGGTNQISLEVNNMPKGWPEVHDPGHGHISHLPFGAQALIGVPNAGIDFTNIKEPGNPGAPVRVEVSKTGVSIPNKGKGVAFDNRPAYYALYFIQKL